MIRQDRISKMLIVAAMLLCVYLATFENSTLIMFPGILLTFGLIMEWFLEKKREDVSDSRDKGSWKEIGFYTVLSVGGMALVAWGTSYKPWMIMVPASGIAYVVLMAISEEQFFRGFITDLLLSKFNRKILAVILAGFLFAIYHIAMYSTNPDAMLYVLAGGVILSWVAYRSRRLSPGMIAHIFNNVRAVIGM